MATVNKVVRSVYTGNDVATYTLDEVARRIKNRDQVVATGVPIIDKYVKPVMPGDVTFILANTSHGKTAFMQFWARQAVAQLQANEDEKQLVVFITWETLVEELGLYDLCGMTGLDASEAWYGNVLDGDMEKLRTAGMKRAGMPLWVVGYSLKRRREVKLTMEVVSQALEAVEASWGKKPAMIFLDYLQRITPRDRRMDRRSSVMENVDGIQDLARDCGCPVVVGCQAGRQVLLREFKLPELGDGQETSRIEQDADKVIALWYPVKSDPLGTPIDELSVNVEPDLMVMGVRKQRHYSSGHCFPLRFDPPHNTFTGWQ